MKKLLILLSLVFIQVLPAQIAVNEDGSSPYTSAILDIKSTTKGILIPRMSAADRDNISPVTRGLTVFVNDEKTYYYYDGSKWVSMGNDNDWLVNSDDDIYNGNSGFVGIGTQDPVANLDVNPGSLNGTVNPLRIVVNAQVTPGSSNGYSLFKASGGTTYCGGKVYGLNIDLSGGTCGKHYGVYIYGETQNYFSNNVGIGTESPRGALDVKSTTGALIVPRMGTSDRDNLPHINGSIIYNTDTNEFNFYENGAWVTKVNN